MFSTVNSVKEYTGYDVSLDLIKRAQSIIEIYVGRDEVDITNPSDLLLLDKLTSYQTTYMLENEEIVFKQIGLTSINSSSQILDLSQDTYSPYIAPLVFIGSKGLSWNRSKSFRTGRIFQKPARIDWKRY